MGKLETIELFIDEENIKDGIDAISLVEAPAIEENFVALSKHKIDFKTINEEKRIVVGLALVPDKEIYRRSGDYEFNIKFSKDTVKKAAHLFLKRLKVNNATLEHETKVQGVSVVESWVVEDVKNDKANVYNLNAVEGAWCVIMRIDNDDIWKEVKQGKYLGFSIEGMFSDELERPKEPQKESLTYEDVKNIARKNVDDITEEEADMLLTVVKEMLK